MTARATRDPKRALERLGPLMPRMIVKREGREVEIRTESSDAGVVKSTIKALAFLADLVRHTPDGERIRAEVRWTGPVPSRGISGWERAALEWLAGGAR